MGKTKISEKTVKLQLKKQKIKIGTKISEKKAQQNKKQILKYQSTPLILILKQLR